MILHCVDCTDNNKGTVIVLAELKQETIRSFNQFTVINNNNLSSLLLTSNNRFDLCRQGEGPYFKLKL